MKSQHFGLELDRFSRALFPTLFFFFQIVLFAMDKGQAGMIRWILFVILAFAFCGLAMYLYLKMKSLPLKLWKKGIERSKTHEDMTKFVPLDDS